MSITQAYWSADRNAWIQFANENGHIIAQVAKTNPNCPSLTTGWETLDVDDNQILVVYDTETELTEKAIVAFTLLDNILYKAGGVNTYGLVEAAKYDINDNNWKRTNGARLPFDAAIFNSTNPIETDQLPLTPEIQAAKFKSLVTDNSVRREILAQLQMHTGDTELLDLEQKKYLIDNFNQVVINLSNLHDNFPDYLQHLQRIINKDDELYNQLHAEAATTHFNQAFNIPKTDEARNLYLTIKENFFLTILKEEYDSIAEDLGMSRCDEKTSAVIDKLSNTINDIGNIIQNGRYSKASQDAVATLKADFNNYKEAFLKTPGLQYTRDTFIRQCKTLLDNARPELEKHRSLWGRLIQGIANLVNFIARREVIVLSAEARFFKSTDSAQRLDKMQETLDELGNNHNSIP